ncbi:MAG: helix-turn-helix domain-containing protein [Treponemataceae bacterium]|nr:helix-turn-helix domain-containing protein [Treponemataceae bacterium]
MENNSVGDMLKKIISGSGDSQKEAASKLGFSAAYINRVLKGTDDASMELIKRIYKVYNIKEKELDELFISAVKGSKKQIKIEKNPVSMYSEMLAYVLKLMTFESTDFIVLDNEYKKVLNEVKEYASKIKKHF